MKSAHAMRNTHRAPRGPPRAKQQPLSIVVASTLRIYLSTYLLRLCDNSIIQFTNLSRSRADG